MQLTKKKKYLIAGVILLAIAIAAWVRRDQPAIFQTAEVIRSDLIYEVGLTGKVKPAESIELAFEKSGKIAGIHAQVGQQVKAGQLLVSQNNAELAAQLQSAQAALDRERIKLTELEKGARAEDLAVKQSELQNAEQNLANAYTNARLTLTAAFNSADKAIRVELTDILVPGNINGYDFSYQCVNNSLTRDGAYQRGDIETDLQTWNAQTANLDQTSPTAAELESALTQGQQYLQTFLQLTDLVGETLSAATPCYLSAASRTAYKTDNAAARALLLNAQEDLAGAEQDISSDRLSMEKIQNELDLKLAGSVPEQIQAQQAAVKQQEAVIQQYQAQIAKGLITSPITGTVTKQTAKLGQIVSANEILIAVISDNQYEIEAYLPEADIARVRLRNPAEVTLDAYSSDVKFPATVTQIDPAETVIDGISTYKITLAFGQPDERIRSGLTANLDILSDERHGVLVVPQRAVYIRDETKFVKVLAPDARTAIEAPVKTGLRGSDGNVEILEGLTEGQRIIIAEQP